MKRVLVLSYYFPPMGGAGVQRTVKFVKHMRESRYEPVVVTGAETDIVGWAPPDPAVAAEVPEDIQVLRAVRGPRRVGRRTRAARLAGLRSPFERWWEHEATRLGSSVASDARLVYASMSPFSTASAAERIARRAAIPWVADLRDPWALDEWAVYPSAVHRKIDLRRMRRALREADAVIMNTPEAASALLADLGEPEPPVVTIPNGWDRDDFSTVVRPRSDARFRIVYVGYAHVATGRRHARRGRLRELLSGAVAGIDPLARSHVFLLEALERVREIDPELYGRVELHVAGPHQPGAAGTSPHVRDHGYLPHDEAVALLRSADVLFLPMHDLPLGVRSRAVPGKTYEYLAAGPPILAALPDGDARDLLGRMSGVWLCRPKDVRGMAAALVEIATLDRSSSWTRDIARFERRRLTEELVSVFDAVVAERPAR